MKRTAVFLTIFATILLFTRIPIRADDGRHLEELRKAFTAELREEVKETRLEIQGVGKKAEDVLGSLLPRKKGAEIVFFNTTTTPLGPRKAYIQVEIKPEGKRCSRIYGTENKFYPPVSDPTRRTNIIAACEKDLRGKGL